MRFSPIKIRISSNW